VFGKCVFFNEKHQKEKNKQCRLANQNQGLRNVCCFRQKMNTRIQIIYTGNRLFEVSFLELIRENVLEKRFSKKQTNFNWKRFIGIPA